MIAPFFCINENHALDAWFKKAYGGEEEIPVPGRKKGRNRGKQLDREEPPLCKGWCSAQRIKIAMIAGGNHTTIYRCQPSRLTEGLSYADASA